MKKKNKLKEELKEGENTPDAATYVRIHKQISVPAEYVSKELKEQKGKGWIAYEHLEYVDKDGNIAEVEIDYSQIDSINISRSSWKMGVTKLIDELEQHGFEIENILPFTSTARISGNIPRPFFESREKYRQDMKKIQQEKTRKEFDF